MILYGENQWDSPYVFTVFVALTEKRIPFETRALDLSVGEQASPEHRARSLTARVPSIDHDGFALSESLAIVEYLEERFPPPSLPRLWPEGAQERARARQLMNFVRSDLMALREERSTETMFYEHTDKPLSPKAQAATEKLVFFAGEVVDDEHKPLFGAWCIADADLAFVLHRLILNGDPVPEKVRHYAVAQWQHPSVRAFLEIDRSNVRRS